MRGKVFSFHSWREVSSFFRAEVLLRHHWQSQGGSTAVLNRYETPKWAFSRRTEQEFRFEWRALKEVEGAQQEGNLTTLREWNSLWVWQTENIQRRMRRCLSCWRYENIFTHLMGYVTLCVMELLPFAHPALTCDNKLLVSLFCYTFFSILNG